MTSALNASVYAEASSSLSEMPDRKHQLHVGSCANLNVLPSRTESETLGWGPATCVLTNPPGDSDAA